MIYTCKANGTVVATVDGGSTTEEYNQAWAKVNEIAREHVHEHYAVYDANGDLEFDSGPGVP